LIAKAIDQEGEEGQCRCLVTQLETCQAGGFKRPDTELPVEGDPEIDDCCQHQQRARHGVKHDLEGCRSAFRTTVDPDHEEYRDQHDLPEGVEQDQIGGAYRPGHGPLGNQQAAIKGSWSIFDDDKDDGNQGGSGQQDEQADAVNPDPVEDPYGFYQRAGFGELELAVAGESKV